MDWILVVDLGHLCLIEYFDCLDFVNVGWEGNMPDYWYLLIIVFAWWTLAWNLLGCAFEYFPPPMNIEDNVQFRFGGTFAQRHDAWFSKIVCQIFRNYFVILPYLSMLCLWRLFFTWCSEELCIFASVWFRLTSCHLGCHWTKCVNLFLLMLSELSNLLEG